MKKIRLIKDRSIEEHTEQDLRGLGDDPVLECEYPWVFLTIIGNYDLALETTKIFNTSIKQGKQSNTFHIYKKHNDITHKQKTLILLTSSLYILAKNPSSSMMLGQLNTMYYKLQNTPGEKIFEELSTDFSGWQKHIGVFLPEHINTYLKHACIYLPTNQITQFNINDLDKFLEVQELVSKVGG